MTAGYSGTPLGQKLGIKDGSRVAVLAAGVQQPLEGPYDVIVFFATHWRDVASELPELRKLMEPNARLWIGWPKRGSKIETDITENVLRDVILPSGLVDNKVAAIDGRWSGLQFVIRLVNR